MTIIKNYIPIITRNILAGLTTPIVKILNNNFQLYTLLFIRQCLIFIISLFTFNYLSLIKELKEISFNSKMRLVLSTVLNSFCIYLIFYAYQYVPVHMFSLIEQSFMLIMSILFGFIFLKERLSKKVYISVTFLLIGLIFVLTAGDFKSLGDIPLYGTVVLFVYAVIATATSTMSVKVVKEMTSKNYLFATNLLRVILYLPLPFIFKESFSAFLSVLSIFLVFLLILAACSNFIVDWLPLN